MSYIFKRSLRLAMERKRVFEIFANAANLEKITPRELQFEILTPQPLEMKKGLIIDYKLRLFGIPFRWKTEITEWNPPDYFVDSQLRGPYRKWVHRHTFKEDGGGTIMEDEVQYQLPFGLAGKIALPLVQYQVEKIFFFREKAIRQLLKAE